MVDLNIACIVKPVDSHRNRQEEAYSNRCYEYNNISVCIYAVSINSKKYYNTFGNIKFYSINLTYFITLVVTSYLPSDGKRNLIF